MEGNKVTVRLDPKSQDQTKVIVTGIPKRAEWQELKDHFAPIGQIMHAEVLRAVKGEVRFNTPEEAQEAVNLANGCSLEGGGPLSACLDPRSSDHTKVIVGNIPPGTGWQDIKDFFNSNGIPCVYSGVIKNQGKQFAEVRYRDADTAQQAVDQLNGSVLVGDTITVRIASDSQDSTRLLITGLGPTVGWQDVKDHFKELGEVVFCETGKGSTAGGKGFGRKGGFGGSGGGGGDMAMMMKMMGMMTQMMGSMGGRGGRFY